MRRLFLRTLVGGMAQESTLGREEYLRQAKSFL